MPQYLDHHPTIPDMPPEMVAFITQRLESDQPDTGDHKKVDL